jgi:hypothetical protein
MLIWQPYTMVRRRQPILKRADVSVLPSWSWVGWQGNLHSESWRSAYDYMRFNTEEFIKGDGENGWQPSSWHTISTIAWYFSENLSSERLPIKQMNRASDLQQALESSTTSGQGWTRHWCKVTYRHFYRHECDPNQ